VLHYDGPLGLSCDDTQLLAADGSTVERGVQNMLDLSCKTRKILTIVHPKSGQPNIPITIPLYGPQEQAIALLQDSQHGLKTLRNATFSGARLLVLGNYVVLYYHFRRISTEGGPLFHRDVEKVDRQDDSAAIRLFSADALQWLTENYPALLGPIIYLFVFGELIDAYQNRHISHIERVTMILRTLFFMEMWEEFLIKAHYARAKYFVSKEACDIIKFLIHGFLKLIIIYRDYLPRMYPLLPWLLSTEPCEHVFGLCRQILQDFTMLDFHHMIPKLFLRLRETALFGTHTFSDGKERASGYTHNYCDNRDINLNALSTFPSDDEIQDAAVTAHQQAENLWFLLGFIPSDSGSESDILPSVQLPSIASWFVDSEPPIPGSEAEVSKEKEILVDSDYESDIDHERDSSDSELPEVAQLEATMNRIEDINLSFDEEDKVNTLSFATVALSVNDSMAMYVTTSSLT
jgi:hypothetical protein